MRPRISVCIAHYNGIELIDACIESVRAQECEATVEIIVHDDASHGRFCRAHSHTPSRRDAYREP